MSVKDTILTYFNASAARRLARVSAERFERVCEIRLRADKPVFVSERGRESVLTDDGRLADYSRAGIGGGQALFYPTAADIAETLERVSRYSMYAYEEQIKNGYITLPHGHRVGVAGQAALDGGQIRTLRNIGGLNFRVAHQIKGCADGVIKDLFEDGALCHTIIISPPGFGKTTLLRDIIRQISEGVAGVCAGATVGVADERSEIAGCYLGVPQNDVGPRTDVLDACPKADAVMLLLRAMSPRVIAADELGGKRDARAVAEALAAGVKLLCTAHGAHIDDIKNRPSLRELFNGRVFGRYIVLHRHGAPSVYDQNGGLISQPPPIAAEVREDKPGVA